MKLKTLFGGLVGAAIALLIGNILIDRLDPVHSPQSPNPTLFLVLLSGVGGITGGAIASPIPQGD